MMMRLGEIICVAFTTKKKSSFVSSTKKLCALTVHCLGITRVIGLLLPEILMRNFTQSKPSGTDCILKINHTVRCWETDKEDYPFISNFNRKKVRCLLRYKSGWSKFHMRSQRNRSNLRGKFHCIFSMQWQIFLKDKMMPSILLRSIWGRDKR